MSAMKCAISDSDEHHDEHHIDRTHKRKHARPNIHTRTDNGAPSLYPAGSVSSVGSVTVAGSVTVSMLNLDLDADSHLDSHSRSR